MRKGLATELQWFAVYVCAIVFVGLSFDLGREAAIFALLSYALWLFRNLGRLEAWIADARISRPGKNQFFGIWGEMADDIKLMNQRHEKDKLRLQTVVSRVQQMTSALHDGVILADSRANIEWWNDAANTMVGLREVDLGQRITNILREPRFQHYFDAGEYREPLEIESFRNEGQRLLFQVHPFGAGERLIIVRDITRVAKLEQMRRDFVANVSHELRTPLTVVRGYVETLMSVPELNPLMQKGLEQMHEQGLRMTSLVNDLITLTKLETDDRSGQNELVDLNRLGGLIINDGRAIANLDHTLVNDIETGLSLRGNEKELRSAISNLVFNAVKYASGDTGNACTIRLSSERSGPMFHLHISDDGVGIDPKHIPRLTERFYRVDGGRSSGAGGTGLGLAIVKHVLLRHDAILRIASRPGAGSTFSCSFPIERLVVAEKNQAPSAVAP
ncbi:phosphate regulon sensor histidine kinase PhoR [Agaribacterium haliotis]|uniref:phosphate regulon sensor histidine kinase PhoR n=1 Tax=Agaribacterium haliotis TaxID=2013869 RepID=UPI000BB53D51|nr:phosphate regulon sensor histidine kinase PhoR [Agaribacterium haliotis]